MVRVIRWKTHKQILDQYVKDCRLTQSFKSTSNENTSWSSERVFGDDFCRPCQDYLHFTQSSLELTGTFCCYGNCWCCCHDVTMTETQNSTTHDPFITVEMIMYFTESQFTCFYILRMCMSNQLVKTPFKLQKLIFHGTFACRRQQKYFLTESFS